MTEVISTYYTYATLDGAFEITARVISGTPNTLDWIQLRVGTNPPVSLDPATVDTLDTVIASLLAKMTELGIVLTPVV